MSSFDKKWPCLSQAQPFVLEQQMEKMIKAYFGYLPIRLYWAINLMVLAYIIGKGWVFQYWYLVFLPLPLAPFYEWLAHRFFLHLKIPESWGPIYRYMQRSHYDHHSDPNHPVLVFAQLSLSLFLLIKFAVIFYFTLSFEKALVAWWAVLTFYLFYEWTHLGHHMNGYNHLTRFGAYMKKAHLWHHFKNANYWWGITSPFADYLFGTFPDPNEVTAKTSQAKYIQGH